MLPSRSSGSRQTIAQRCTPSIDAYAEAAGYAKKWLILVQGIDVGTNDEEDIIDPAKWLSHAVGS